MDSRLVVIRGLREGSGRREVDVDIKDNMRDPGGDRNTGRVVS